jgi:hypothetical protein
MTIATSRGYLKAEGTDIVRGYGTNELADTLDLIDADMVTALAGVAGGVTLTGVQTLSNKTFSDTILMSAAASRIRPGATSFAIRNNADSADNLLVANNGDVTVRNNLSLTASAAGIGIGSAAAANTILRMVSTITASAGLGLGWHCGPSIFAGANGDELAAIYGGLSVGEASKTGLLARFIHITNPGGLTAATTYTAILIDSGYSALQIGGSAVRSGTKPTNQIDLFNGTSPTGTLTNGVSLYARAGELYAMDAAGNETIQSPHDRDTGEWIFWSKHTPTGKVLRVDMERLVKALDAQLGGGFVTEYLEEG